MPPGNKKNKCGDFLIFSPQGYKSKNTLIPKAVLAWLLPEKRDKGLNLWRQSKDLTPGYVFLCQSFVQRKSISVPVLSRLVGKP